MAEPTPAPHSEPDPLSDPNWLPSGSTDWMAAYTWDIAPAIDGLAEEAGEIMQEAKDETVRDAGMLAAAQAVEHYEITRYGTLIAWAEELGHDDIVRFLTTNLNEEKAANTKLNTVALRKGGASWDKAKKGGVKVFPRLISAEHYTRFERTLRSLSF